MSVFQRSDPMALIVRAWCLVAVTAIMVACGTDGDNPQGSATTEVVAPEAPADTTDTASEEDSTASDSSSEDPVAETGSNKENDQQNESAPPTVIGGVIEVVDTTVNEANDTLKEVVSGVVDDVTNGVSDAVGGVVGSVIGGDKVEAGGGTETASNDPLPTAPASGDVPNQNEPGNAPTEDTGGDQANAADGDASESQPEEEALASNGDPSEDQPDEETNADDTTPAVADKDPALPPGDRDVLDMFGDGSGASHTIRWEAPNSRENGTALSPRELAKIEIWLAKGTDSLTLFTTVDAANSSYTLSRLPAGQYRLALVAVDNGGRRSGFSEESTYDFP